MNPLKPLNPTQHDIIVDLQAQLAKAQAELFTLRGELGSVQSGSAKVVKFLRSEIKALKAKNARLAAALEQEVVQHAGCLTAAEGCTKDPAVKGQYGWSLAYQKTLELRLKYDALRDLLGPTVEFIESVDRYLAGAGPMPNRLVANRELARLRAAMGEK